MSNYIDIIVLMVILAFVIRGYSVGLIKTLFKLCNTIICYIGAFMLYPHLSKFFRETGIIYNGIKASILENFLAGEGFQDATLSTQQEIITNLPVPEFLRNVLLTNNNNVVYEIFKVTTIKDYIAAYMANFIVNILSMIIIFFVLLIVLRFVVEMLDIVSKLPVLNLSNKAFGAALGAVRGVLIVWFVFLILSLFISNSSFEGLFLAISKSRAGLFLYENNLLVKYVLSIF